MVKLYRKEKWVEINGLLKVKRIFPGIFVYENNPKRQVLATNANIHSREKILLFFSGKKKRFIAYGNQ